MILSSLNGEKKMTKYQEITLKAFEQSLKDAHRLLEGEELEKCVKALYNYMKNYEGSWFNNEN